MMKSILALFLLASTPAWAFQCVAGSGTDYEVGEGHNYSDLATVPWSTLKPGDTVRIHWRSTPYNQKITFTASGTKEAPIVVCGIPNKTGDLPILSGQDAITPSTCLQHSYMPLQHAGLFLVVTPKGSPTDYKPSHIVIQGLRFEKAFQAYSFTNSTGTVLKYNRGSSGIYIYNGDDITIRGCEITDNGNGIFVNTHPYWIPTFKEALWSSNILIDHNMIWGNGDPGSFLSHNIYAEAMGITYQYNIIGPQRLGGLGSALKDRSAGAVIRYNKIVGCARNLDLVNAQNSLPDGPRDPRYSTTTVYGNIIVNGPEKQSVRAVHFGGDDYVFKNYRPHLEFYNNTVIFFYDQKTYWSIALFQLDTSSQSVHAYKNIVMVRPVTPGSVAPRLNLTDTAGQITLGKNWFTSGYGICRQATCTATVTGAENIVTNPENDPGFTSSDPLAWNVQLRLFAPARRLGALVSRFTAREKIKFLRK